MLIEQIPTSAIEMADLPIITPPRVTRATVPINRIICRERIRTVSDETVDALVASIDEVGLLNPLTVSHTSIMNAGKAHDGYRLISGLHRFEAVKKLGWTEVAVTVLDLIGPAAVIAECDENLCGTNLSKAERALFTKHRKAAYIALHPETKAHVAGAHAANRTMGNAAAKLAIAFTADTAAKTNRSERDIRRDAQRGENVSDDVLNEIAGTELDTGKVLDELAKVPEQDQRTKLDEIKADRAARLLEEEQAKELRKHNAATDASPAAPLRLIYVTNDGDPVDEYGNAIDPGPTDLEYAAWDLLDGIVCPTPNRGFPFNTQPADLLVTLIERDPQDLVAYIRKFASRRAAAYQPKAKKRKVERKLAETEEIPF